MKNQGNEITEFGQLLSKTMGKQIKVQTHWADVTEVDWEAKTMTVKGTADDLEFYDVLLGLGSFYRKPKVGSRCLIGMVMNQKAATFLIDCSEIEESVWTSGETEFTIKENGFIVKQGDESLKPVFNDLIDKINELNQEVQKIIVIQGTSPSIPDLAQLVLDKTEIKNRLNTILIA